MNLARSLLKSTDTLARNANLLLNGQQFVTASPAQRALAFSSSAPRSLLTISSLPPINGRLPVRWSSSSSHSHSSHSSQFSVKPWLIFGWSLFGLSKEKKEEKGKIAFDELIELSAKAFKDGRALDAAKYAMEALKINSYDWRGFRALSYALCIDGDVERAIDNYSQGIELLSASEDPNHLKGAVKLLDELTFLCFETEQPAIVLDTMKAAMFFFQKSLQNNSDPYWNNFDIFLELNLAKAYNSLFLHDEALQQCQKIENRIKEVSKDTSMGEFASMLDAELTVLRAYIFQTIQDLPKATEQLNKIQSSPSVPLHCDVWRSLLEANELLNQPNQAGDRLLDDAISKAMKLELEVKGDDTLSYLKQRGYASNKLLLSDMRIRKAQILMDQKKFNNAFEELEKVLSNLVAMPLHQEVHLNAAFIFLQLGRLKESLREVDNALFWGDKPGLYLMKAKILFQDVSQRLEAIKAVENEIEKFPDTISAYYTHGQYCEVLKKRKEAVKSYRDGILAIKKYGLEKQGIILFRAKLAENLSYLGDFKNAQIQIERAIKLGNKLDGIGSELLKLKEDIMEAKETMESTGKNTFGEITDKRRKQESS